MPEVITQKLIEKVLRSNKREEITDAKTSGLMLRGRSTGVTWAFRSNRGGANAKATLGTYPGMSLVQARQVAHACNERVRVGLPIDERWLSTKRVEVGAQDEVPVIVPMGRIRPLTWTYEEALVAYLEKIYPNVRPATLTTYRQKLTHPAVKAAFFGKPVCEIERKHASRVVEDISIQHSTTAEDLVGNFRRFWEWMSEDNQREKSGVPENIMLGLKRPARPLERKKGAHIKKPDLMSVGRIVAACRSGILHPSTARALEIVVLTAQRRETVASAWVSEVDFTTSPPVWMIGGDRMKKGLDHHIPLSPRAAEIFREAIDEAIADGSTFAFPQVRPRKKGDEVSYVHPDTLSHYAAYVGDGVTPHRIRISFTSSCGLKTHEAAVVLDHMEGRVDVTGIHYDRDQRLPEKGEYLEKWEKALAPYIREAQKAFDPAKTLDLIRQAKKAATKGKRKLVIDKIRARVVASIQASAKEKAEAEEDRQITEDVLEALRVGALTVDEVRYRLRLDG